MTHFLRLLSEIDKASSLQVSCMKIRSGTADKRCFEVDSKSFDSVPGKPFAYWVSESVRGLFDKFDAIESHERTARQGLATAEDFRFVRAWWESQGSGWLGFAKGGAYSPYYSDVYLLVNWSDEGSEIKAGICKRYPYLNGNSDFVAKNTQFYTRAGLTWSLRSQIGLGIRAMPGGCVFGHKGPAAFVVDDDPLELLPMLAVVNSKAFSLLVSLQMAFGSYEVGVIQRTPVPMLAGDKKVRLTGLARRAWSLKYNLDVVDETSHAFSLPMVLRPRLGAYDVSRIKAELASVQDEIDEISFDLYGFSDADRAVALGGTSDGVAAEVINDDDEVDETEVLEEAPIADSLFSWAIGVVFGRFDWRLATGKCATPPEPEPFDPLPAKSPGMLPDAASPFHQHAGILVDDLGHPHDLARLVDHVLETVEAPVAEDVRRWLQKDFFVFHLKRYSKSRRKAPIYWPLATVSGSYTLWLYYPSLSDQTLFTAVNDFVDPKLESVRKELQTLRDKGTSRSKQDEKSLETLTSLEHELANLRDGLLEIAPNYRPDHNDGVQITAAPLWKLFRHKPWQKVLKDTWVKLEKGDYDWAHLAMNYWSQRVRDKCTTDKSLAIAHNLEHLYIEPEIAPKKARGRAKKQDV